MEDNKINFDSLTSSERRRLRRLTLGYGAFREQARAAGMHVNTLRRILNVGRGQTETIQKVRTKILQR